MRTTFLLLPLLIGAAPALAQTPAAPPAPPPASTIEIAPQLADPAIVDNLTNAMQAMSKAFLDLPVGNVEAALEHRKPGAADRQRTVRSETGMSEHDISARIAGAKPQIERSMRALNQALPEITSDLQRAQQSIERALANMPDPNYPRR